VGDDSYTVESTAASLAEFKSAENIRSLRRDFAAKLGIPLAELSEIRVDESTVVINPRARGLSNDSKAKRIIENHKVEWLRVAQLAVPEVATATGPRFCDGGADAEKAVVGEGLLSVRDTASQLTRNWHLTLPYPPALSNISTGMISSLAQVYAITVNNRTGPDRYLRQEAGIFNKGFI
jgi:hypothetical protein